MTEFVLAFDPNFLTCEEIPMNSIELHAVLTSTFAEAEHRIRAETSDAGAILISAHFSAGYAFSIDGLSFTIRTGFSSKSGNTVEVSGRDFWDCVSEFTRRLAFAERQASLKLGPPTIDADSAT
jgi:hypothetical protein